MLTVAAIKGAGGMEVHEDNHVERKPSCYFVSLVVEVESEPPN
jgi:hypothetical protein